MTSPAALKTLPAAAPCLPSRREIRWGQALLAVFLLLVSLPYLWCALLTPPGMVWGGLLFSADDQNVHLMWAKQAAGGSFFIRDLFTTEGLISGAHPLFFNLFTLVLGWFSRLTTLDVVFGYHIARVAFAGLFLHQFHRLLLAATNGAPERENARLGALALAVFSTGGSFLVAVFPKLLGRVIFLDYPANPSFPAVPEAFALLSAFVFPLNIASFALICFLLRALIENKGAGKAFVAALVLANIHTYDALPLLLACALGLTFSLARREVFKEKLAVWGAVVGGLLIPVAYQVLVFRGSEEFRVKALTPTLPPPLFHTVATFFPLLLLGAWGWKSQWAKGAQRWLLIYTVSVFALVYAPSHLFNFSRKMIEGGQIPLLIFAGAGLAMLPLRRFLAPAVVGICALSPLLFWSWTLGNAAENNLSRVQTVLMPPLYVSNADAGAFLALKSVPDKTKAVLCLPLLGSYVPRATGLFVFNGHWAETLHFERKLHEESRFYRGEMAPDEARAWLRSNRIGTIIESPFERSLGSGSSTALSLGFKAIYSANTPNVGDTVVYEVGP